MILDVPYQSQEPLENGATRKWCGIASLWMILAYFLKKSPSVEEILEKYGESFEFSGFQHRDLLKIAREYGLTGFRKSWWAEPGVDSLIEKFKMEGESDGEIEEWMQTNINEGIFTIKEYLKGGIPVIVSVSKHFSPSQSTHLIVVIGCDGDELIIHDPYKKGEGYRIPTDEFKKYWIRQAIIIFAKT